MVISLGPEVFILNKWSEVYTELEKYFHFSEEDAENILKKFEKPRLIYKRDKHRVYHVVIDNEDFVFKIKPDSLSIGGNYWEKLQIVEEMWKNRIPTSEVIYLKDDPNKYESHSLEFYLDVDLTKVKLDKWDIKLLLKEVEKLHQKGIIHGDLRLENILFKFNENSRDCNFYFIDFETFMKTNSVYAQQYDFLRLYYSLKKHGYEVDKKDFVKFNIPERYFTLIDEKAKKYV